MKVFAVFPTFTLLCSCKVYGILLTYSYYSVLVNKHLIGSRL